MPLAFVALQHKQLLAVATHSFADLLVMGDAAGKIAFVVETFRT